MKQPTTLVDLPETIMDLALLAHSKDLLGVAGPLEALANADPDVAARLNTIQFGIERAFASRNLKRLRWFLLQHRKVAAAAVGKAVLDAMEAGELSEDLRELAVRWGYPL